MASQEERKQFQEALKESAELLLHIHLPRWEELPDIELYMDQILQLVPRYLAFLSSTDDDVILTPAMINNYVKQGFIPRPHKKKYQREHVVYLLIVVLMKPIFSLADIKEGMERQVEAVGGDHRRAYNMFCKLFEYALREVAGVTLGDSPNHRFLQHLPSYTLGTYMAVRSVAARVMADETLRILRHLEEERTPCE